MFIKMLRCLKQSRDVYKKDAMKYVIVDLKQGLTVFKIKSDRFASLDIKYFYSENEN
jgi:hypothetical protein